MDRRPLRLTLPALVAAVALACSGCNYRFAAWADSRGDSSGVDAVTLAALSNQLAPRNPAFTFFAGDFCYSGPSTDCMNQWLAAANGGSTPGNGLTLKTFGARGNHDHDGLSVINAALNPATTAARITGISNFARNGDDLTYGFDFQGDHFVMVDLPHGDVGSMPEATLDWVDADLTRADSRGVANEFLFGHGPIVCGSTSHTCHLTPGMVAALNRHPHIRALFAGHEHINAHTVLSSANVPGLAFSFDQFIDGTAGAPHYTCKSGVVGMDFCVTYDAFDSIDVTGPGKFTVSIFERGVADPTKVYVRNGPLSSWTHASLAGRTTVR